jgi:hypothetical protein
MILGSKFYINYAKKPFDTAYSETLAELQAVINTTEKKSTVSPPKKRIVYFNTVKFVVRRVFFSCASTGTTSSIGSGNCYSK